MAALQDPRSLFDAALVPGMRERLAQEYAAFRSMEAVFRARTSPAGEIDGSKPAYRDRDCPVCAGVTCEPVLRAHEIDVVRCLACGLTYARQVMDEATDAARYESSEFDERSIRLRLQPPYLELESARARYYLTRLEEGGFRPGSLLDIGCGTGTFALEAAARGWAASGVEPGRRAAGVARGRGVAVAEGYFPDDLPDRRARFDAIALLDVLEHFADPLSLLRDVAIHLRAGGRVFVQVPNWDSLLVQIEGAESSIVCPGHWSYFTPATLADLMGRAGFRPIAVETVVSELDRIAAYPTARRDAALARLRRGVDAAVVSGVSEGAAAALHAERLGYKLIGVFERTD